MRAGQLLLSSGQQHSRNKYIYSYTPNREKQWKYTGKQFQTDTSCKRVSLSASRLSSCFGQLTHLERGQPVPQTTSAQWPLFQPCFCPVNIRFLFLSAAVSFLPLPPTSPAPASPQTPSLCLSPVPRVRQVLRRLGGRRGAAGVLQNEGKESCLKCRPKRWWAFPWKQCSQQSVTSSVREEAPG